MTVLVIGATESAARALGTLAPAGVRLVTHVSSHPDWVLVATSERRLWAVGRYRLPPYRVIEVPAIAAELTDATVRADLQAGLDTMARIGRLPGASRVGMAIGGLIVRRMAGPKGPTVAGPRGATLPESAGADETPIGIGVAGIRPRIPVGARMNAVLSERALERVRRFVSHAVRLD